MATRWIRYQPGHRVLWRNYRPKGGGEVDLVYREHQVLVFSEIKTRSNRQFGLPSDAVDEEKQSLIIRGAMDWLRRLDAPDVCYRFDILEVVVLEGRCPDVRKVSNAFQLPDAYHI